MNAVSSIMSDHLATLTVSRIEAIAEVLDMDPGELPLKLTAHKRRDSMSTPALDPIFVSVNEAARLLSLTPWSVYTLCESDQIDARLRDGRRLVRLDSVRAYAGRLEPVPMSAG